MSAFDDAFRVAHGLQLAYFGDRVRLTPTAPQGASPASGARRPRYVVGAADPARAVRVLLGVFSGDPLAAKVAGSGANSRANAEVATARYTFAFASADFAGLPFPAMGDLVVAVGDDDQPVPGSPEYKITLVEPDAVSEIVCHLAERVSSP